ncbi:hypothetical protein [Granulicella sp. L60]|uniref:hypothetical protein n=1 Tax=Granulicella sp. L60 TaxID=1641866 RepID=UPI00131D3936|nr:hypothetical protein [Granulicella sp. L60]
MNSVQWMRSIAFAAVGTLVLAVGSGGAAMGQMPQTPSMPSMPGMPPTPSAPPTPSMPQMPDIPQGNPNLSTPDMPQPSQSGPTDAARGSANGAQGAGFLGTWCVQGDRTKQASISSNGAFLNLTNESGDTSIGNLQGSNQIVAPGWQFVTGTLSGNGGTINWSNGTYWTRCGSGGGGGGHSSYSLNGNWYPNGNRSLQCSIQQHRGNLTLQNESGQRATGSLVGRRQLTTNWAGTTIRGTVSSDGNRINWDNGTYWIRYRLY